MSATHVKGVMMMMDNDDDVGDGWLHNRYHWAHFLCNYFYFSRFKSKFELVKKNMALYTLKIYYILFETAKDQLMTCSTFKSRIDLWKLLITITYNFVCFCSTFSKENVTLLIRYEIKICNFFHVILFTHQMTTNIKFNMSKRRQRDVRHHEYHIIVLLKNLIFFFKKCNWLIQFVLLKKNVRKMLFKTIFFCFSSTNSIFISTSFALA